MVVEAQVPAEGLYQQGGLAQVVAGQCREEVVLYLELQAPMKPVQPDRTAPVHSPTHLYSPAAVTHTASLAAWSNKLTASSCVSPSLPKGLLHFVVPLAHTNMDL